jgi:hypothetical protein
MNRALIAAVAAAAAEVHRAARELLAAEADGCRFESLRRHQGIDAWPPSLQNALDQRITDARWRYDYNVTGLRRLTTKEPT